MFNRYLRKKEGREQTLRCSQGPEEICLSLEHQNPQKTSEKMVFFYRVTVSLHILQTANQDTEGSQDRLTVFYSSTQISKFRLVFEVMTFAQYFFFVPEHIYQCKSRLIFFIAFGVFYKFDLRIMFSTCFYHRYNFVRNGTP